MQLSLEELHNKMSAEWEKAMIENVKDPDDEAKAEMEWVWATALEKIESIRDTAAELLSD